MYPEVRYFPFRIADNSWFGHVPLAQSLHVGIATSAHEQIHIQHYTTYINHKHALNLLIYCLGTVNRFISYNYDMYSLV